MKLAAKHLYRMGRRTLIRPGTCIGRVVVIGDAGVDRKRMSLTTICDTVLNERRVVRTNALMFGQIAGLHAPRGYVTDKILYQAVASHYQFIFSKGCPTYRGLPFQAEWNPGKGGSYIAGMRHLLADIGKRPKGKWELHIIDRQDGFVRGNLMWVPKTIHQRFELINAQAIEIRRLKLQLEARS